MDEVRPLVEGRVRQSLHVQIGFDGRRSFGKEEAVVGEGDVGGVDVFGGADGQGASAEGVRGAGDAKGDFAAVGDQDCFVVEEEVVGEGLGERVGRVATTAVMIVAAMAWENGWGERMEGTSGEDMTEGHAGRVGGTEHRGEPFSIEMENIVSTGIWISDCFRNFVLFSGFCSDSPVLMST